MDVGGDTLYSGSASEEGLEGTTDPEFTNQDFGSQVHQQESRCD